MCCTLLQLSSRIFWILVKFHSNSCRCSDTWLTDWTVRTYSDFGTEQLFYQQPVELFAVHQINHFPVACCEHNLPHNLLGQWFIWWMVLLIQSNNSKYLRVKFNYCNHLTGEATWNVSVYLVCLIEINVNLCIEK